MIVVTKSAMAGNRSVRLSTICRGALLALVLVCAGTATAWAYVGDSFIKIPGVTGSWQGANYQNWIRVEANYWKFRPTRLDYRLLEGDRLVFSGPDGPRPGVASTLVISMSKKNPDLAKLMDLCGKKTPIPELTYVQSSDVARSPLEIGPHPAAIPDHWEYKLKDVLISDCPVVADAPDQALVVYFKDSEWLNYDSKAPEATKIVPEPRDLQNNKPTAPVGKKKTRAFAITWIAPATFVSDAQCAVMNSKPTEDDYYALVPKEEAAAERIKLGEKGVSYGGLMDNRGPHRLNATKLPGIVRDPGFTEPNTAAALGVNLDGDDGSGQPPAGICKHKNYVSVDGQRKGIDNQLYTVMGCVPGAEGKKGYRNQTSNTHRADGTITTLLEISGIDNEKNDNSVEVAVIYSKDKLGRDVSGKHFIPDFTFAPTDDPNMAYYARRLHGRIVDGVVITDPVKRFDMNMGLDPLLMMTNSQMRLEFLPDGNLKGVLAGYLDWRRIMEHNTGSYTEQLFGYQAPGMYNALKRAADGQKNPVTGECDGISAAYEIDAISAFITPAPAKAQQGNAAVQRAP
jgi:hypothetical protein